MAKAIITGLIVIILFDAGFELRPLYQFSLALWVCYLGPPMAAFVVAYLAPRNKRIIGLSMALWGAALSDLLPLFYDLIGLPVDHIGLKGNVIRFFMNLVIYGFLCAIGSALGYLLSQPRSEALKD